jgi:hypothetical protein
MRCIQPVVSFAFANKNDRTMTAKSSTRRSAYDRQLRHRRSFFVDDGVHARKP